MSCPPPATRMVEIQNHPGFCVIRLEGSVDAAAIQRINLEVAVRLPPDCANIIIDLEKVEFLDSHGIGFFVSLLKKVYNNKGKLFLAGATAQPASVLDMVGFGGALIIHCEDAEKAILLARQG